MSEDSRAGEARRARRHRGGARSGGAAAARVVPGLGWGASSARCSMKPPRASGCSRVSRARATAPDGAPGARAAALGRDASRRAALARDADRRRFRRSPSTSPRRQRLGTCTSGSRTICWTKAGEPERRCSCPGAVRAPPDVARPRAASVERVLLGPRRGLARVRRGDVRAAAPFRGAGPQDGASFRRVLARSRPLVLPAAAALFALSQAEHLAALEEFASRRCSASAVRGLPHAEKDRIW